MKLSGQCNFCGQNGKWEGGIFYDRRRVKERPRCLAAIFPWNRLIMPKGCDMSPESLERHGVTTRVAYPRCYREKNRPRHNAATSRTRTQERRTNKMGKWIKKYPVPKSSGDGYWTVAKSDTEDWGCSCPIWKFKRQECKHIEAVKNGEYQQEDTPQLNLVLANVQEVTRQEDTILIPLVPIGDTHFQATVCYDLYTAGVPWGTIKNRCELAKLNSKEEIVSYVQANGRKIYGPWNKAIRRHEGFEISRVSQIPDLPKFGESPEKYSTRTGYPLDLAREMKFIGPKEK